MVIPDYAAINMDAVKLGVCVRPMNHVEQQEGRRHIVHASEHEVKVSMGEGKGAKSYECDFEPFYFEDDSPHGRSGTISDVCEGLGDTILEHAFQGHNATLFTYGGAGSGKSCVVYGHNEDEGLILYVLKGLFQKAEDFDANTSFRCQISFFEICGDMITDLVSKRGNIKSSEGVVKLKVKEDSRQGPYVDKLSKHIVTDMVETIKLYEKGVKNRKRLAKLDPDSEGHSHSIFSVMFTQARLDEECPVELVSNINIIDLGSKDGYQGFENCNSLFIEGENGDSDIVEDKKMTEPLETLQTVIRSLAAQNYGSMNYGSSFTSSLISEIPYQDSNLTWLMKEALGGNCETIMLCCISPADSNRHETLNTLKYGNLVRHIKNSVRVNEEQNVQMIRQLKEEIEKMKTEAKQGHVKGDADMEKKLQRDTELMNRLTGIWEEKWSKAQKMIEDKELDVTDLGGKGLRLETKEPHFISLGGGRLSVGVSIIPVKMGFTNVGSGGEGFSVDLPVHGKGIASLHCIVEYDGDAVVLHPKNDLVSVDGIPLTCPTRLPQGCMVCLGKNNYFRFNHPKEAAQIREQITGSRFSIVPDGVYPDVQLAIEQRRKEMQERETLRAENKRLQAMEKQYINSMQKLSFEKEQLEQEKRKLQVLQQQQLTVANQFDRKMKIQIEELELQKEELRSFDEEKKKLEEKEKELEVAVAKSELERRKKEEMKRINQERVNCGKQELELEEFEHLEEALTQMTITPSTTPKLTGKSEKARALEEEKHKLAMLELDLLTDDLEFHERYRLQKEEVQREKVELELMEQKHRDLERNLSDQIRRLQGERQWELEKIEQERERLIALEQAQTDAISQIESEYRKLMHEKEFEKEKLEQERDQLLVEEDERMKALQKAVDEQEQERELINREKMRLIDLEEQHKKALEELEQDMISQQEKLERERQLELEYMETEQLMLEELEAKQFESARQIEYKTKTIVDEVEREREMEMERLRQTESYVKQLRLQHEEALLQSEEERIKIQQKREEEQQQLRSEREKLAKMEEEYKRFLYDLEQEKEELKEKFQKEKDEEIEKVKREIERTCSAHSPNEREKSPVRMFNEDFDPALLLRKRTPEGKMQQIEEERQRLSELKRLAAEKAEMEWMEKKKDLERRKSEEDELRRKKERLEALKKEHEVQAEVERRNIQMESDKIKHHEQLLSQRELEIESLRKEKVRREELERMLHHEKINESLLEQSLNEEKRRLETLERSLAEERSKRAEIEKKYDDRQRQLEEEDRLRINGHHHHSNKKAADSRSNGTLGSSGNGTLKRRIPSYTLSLRSGHSSGPNEDLNLLHHIVAAGHVIENCPSLRINRYSCRGYLSKMGESRFALAWKKRWFVFDRKLRALCYYTDERKTKPKGFIYFQAIQEVYVDSSIKRSPEPKTTFCIKTPQRLYCLSAPSAIAMSIWIDVICTGKEGSLITMTL